jgi:hypothetical protein
MLGCREGQSCHSPRRAPSRATNLSAYAATKKHEEVASSKGEPLQQCCVSASPSLVEVRGGRADRTSCTFTFTPRQLEPRNGAAVRTDRPSRSPVPGGGEHECRVRAVASSLRTPAGRSTQSQNRPRACRSGRGGHAARFARHRVPVGYVVDDVAARPRSRSRRARRQLRTPRRRGRGPGGLAGDAVLVSVETWFPFNG